MEMDHENFYAEIPKWDAVKAPVETGHDRFDPELLSGQLQAIVRTRQPIHIGDGMLVPPESLGLKSEHPLVKSFFRSNQNLRIPGTSLKGAIRSLVEMFTDSCAPASHTRETCSYRNDKDKLCPACRIFGAMGYQGSIQFEDGKFYRGWQNQIMEIPPQYGPRERPGRRRYYPHHLIETRDRTWPLEVILPGAQFLLKASFTNLASGELGMVLIALGTSKWGFCPKIGAGKNSGLGAIQVREMVIEALDVKSAYTQFQPRWKEIKPEPLVKLAEETVSQEVLKQLQEDLSCERIP